jgi:hypothetical protein
MKKLDILLSARLEYEEAVDWYLERSVFAADRFRAEVEQAIEAVHKIPINMRGGTRPTASICSGNSDTSWRIGRRKTRW